MDFYYLKINAKIHFGKVTQVQVIKCKQIKFSVLSSFCDGWTYLEVAVDHAHLVAVEHSL